jgi:alcohol dehydrogenase class IV
MKSFKVAKTPFLEFGAGSLSNIEKYIKSMGVRKAALFTGSHSFRKTDSWETLCKSITASGVQLIDFKVGGEPSPEIVDNASDELKSKGADLIIAVGGGSVLDAGKAVSAMVMSEGSVKDYLEGIGTKEPDGRKVPMIAVPTTSGTGSEATKNAVISSVGLAGFKKSLRHDNYVPDAAVIDPELIVSCPRAVTAASGMDALTQLLESYVSTGASVFTDSIVSQAIRIAGFSLEKAVFNGRDIDARAGMAWASYVSGISLANAGLGVVHGIASPAGAYTDIPHGVVCGSLLSEATKYIISKLLETDPDSEGLRKYGEAGELLTGKKASSVIDRCRLLTDHLDYLTEKLDIPHLSGFGFTDDIVNTIAEKSAGKNSPVKLDTDDIRKIIQSRL